MLYLGQAQEASQPNGTSANYGDSEACTKDDPYCDESYGKTEGKAGQKFTKEWGGVSGEKFEHTWKCPVTGSWYHLWSWGRQMGVHGRTQWSASGWEGEFGGCTKRGPVDMSPIGQAGEPS